jgi:hypothetical protein
MNSADGGETVVPDAFADIEEPDTSGPERSLVLPDEHAAGSAARATMIKVATLRSRVSDMFMDTE